MPYTYMIITDKEAIRKATCSPTSMPDSFLAKELKPIGTMKFKGDDMPEPWSVNPHFTIGKTYGVYYEEIYFVIGNDGKGYKITPAAWTRIKYL